MNIRPYQYDDASQVVSVMNACGIAMTEEKLNRELDEPGERIRENSFVAEIDGQIVGCIRLCFVEGTTPNRYNAYCYGEVHPDFRRQGAGTALYETAISQLQAVSARENSQISFIQNADLSRTDHCRVLEGTGFHDEVRMYGMRLICNASYTEVEVLLPQGYSIRPSTIADASACADIDNASFAWRTQHSVSSVESFEYEMSAPEYDADLYPVLVSPTGTVVGYAHCELQDHKVGKVGKIYTVAVCPDVQGLGLGKSLVKHCIANIAARGAKYADLSVESDNPTPARRLYESLGFEPTRELIRYVHNIEN